MFAKSDFCFGAGKPTTIFRIHASLDQRSYRSTQVTRYTESGKFEWSALMDVWIFVVLRRNLGIFKRLYAVILRLVYRKAFKRNSLQLLFFNFVRTPSESLNCSHHGYGQRRWKSVSSKVWVWINSIYVKAHNLCWNLFIKILILRT